LTAGSEEFNWAIHSKIESLRALSACGPNRATKSGRFCNEIVPDARRAMIHDVKREMHIQCGEG
jgi:hypothetical protein